MYFKDFSSGAMIENIVRRAKKLAIKRAHRRRRAGHPHRRPPRLDPPGVQGARGPAQHDQPRRLGEDLGQEGRAHRVRPHARQADGRRRRGRPADRTGRHRPVPLAIARRGLRAGGAVGRVDSVAIRKVCGIETEYGIVLRGAGDSNPIAASSMLINALRRASTQPARSAGTSRTSRPATTPGVLARRHAWPPEVETHLVNAVLTNGARYYVDHAHPELSTPECADAARDRACSTRPPSASSLRSMEAAARTAARGPGDRRLQEQLRRQGQLLRLPRELPRWTARCRSRGSSRSVMPHFVTRQVFTGAGKVGSEAPASRPRPRCPSRSPSAPTSSRRRSGSRPR